MQISKQLRNNALSRATSPQEYRCGGCGQLGCSYPTTVTPRGVAHTKYVRLRKKSRARHHGTTPGQSKKKSK